MARRSREEEEFTVVFRDLFPRAYRVAYRMLDDRGAAEDVAAEAMSRAFARWSTVSNLDYRDAWVMRVTMNLCLNSLRRHSLLVAPPDPTSIEDATATRLALVAALAALPTRQREVVVLRHLGGLPELEVARALGIGAGTVKTHLKRGLEALRGQLLEQPAI